MEHALLKVIEAESGRECASILAASKREAAVILDRARAEADRILAREPPVPSDVGSNPEVAACRREFLDRYQEKLAQLRNAVAAGLRSSPPSRRHELLASLVRDTVRRAGHHAVRVEAPAEVWSALERGTGWQGDRAVERVVTEDEGALVESDDGRFRATVALDEVVTRHFEAKAERVAALLLGHGTP